MTGEHRLTDQIGSEDGWKFTVSRDMVPLVMSAGQPRSPLLTEPWDRAAARSATVEAQRAMNTVTLQVRAHQPVTLRKRVVVHGSRYSRAIWSHWRALEAAQRAGVRRCGMSITCRAWERALEYVQCGDRR